MSENIAGFLTKDKNVNFVSSFESKKKAGEKVASVSNLFNKPLVKVSWLTSLMVFVMI